MMRITLRVGIVATLAVAAGLTGRVAESAQKASADPASKPAAESDAFFAEGKIPRLVIDIGPKEAESLRREPRKYVKVTLKDGNRSYADAALHLKGAAGSFRPFDDKPSLTLNMDKFADGQTYRGMDKFHLANSMQDGSYLSELICGELFRAAGVPAARVGHAVVTLNGRGRGLYYVKEGYDKYFLRRHFKNKNGNFYDGGFLRDIDQPLELVSGKGDVADRKDLKALLDAAREGNAQKRFQRLEKLLDMDAFISFLVVEVITWDWDGYPMKCNNYRIYHDPDRDKLVFIPSGMDQMFADPNGPAVPGFQGVVARGLMDTPEGKKRYLARMREVLKSVYKPEEMVKRLDELEKRVKPVLTEIDAGAGRDYPNQVERLRQAIRQRAKSLDEQMKKIR